MVIRSVYVFPVKYSSHVVYYLCLLACYNFVHLERNFFQGHMIHVSLYQNIYLHNKDTNYIEKYCSRDNILTVVTFMINRENLGVI